jgi:hypothetical protein
MRVGRHCTLVNGEYPKEGGRLYRGSVDRDRFSNSGSLVKKRSGSHHPETSFEYDQRGQPPVRSRKQPHALGRHYRCCVDNPRACGLWARFGAKGGRPNRNGGFDCAHRVGDAGGICSPRPCASQSHCPSNGFGSVAPHFTGQRRRVNPAAQ